MEQLPASATQWDVSGLLTGGEPFSRDVVKTWVSLAYCAAYGQSELDAQDVQQLSTATGLQQVLAFAQAVGSAEGLVQAACNQISTLKFAIQLPEQTIEVPVAVQSPLILSGSTGGSAFISSTSLQGMTNYGQRCSREHLVMLKQQLAGQLGSLLCSAHVLRMLPMLDVLHNFIFWATAKEDMGLLHGVLGMVFSDEVLEAAVGSSNISKDTYIKNVLTWSVNLSATDLEGARLLMPFGEFHTNDVGATSFRAHLLQSFLGAQVGDEVHASVELLDPGETSCLQLTSEYGEDSVWLPAQLLLGNRRTDRLTDPQGFGALMYEHSSS